MGNNNKRKTRVCFDVDGTLITYRDDPRAKICDLLRSMQENSDVFDVYIWSGGGVQYAKLWAERLSTQKYINSNVKILEKTKQEGNFWGIDICFDDEDVNLAKLNIKV